MPEPNSDTELETLRRTNVELLTKNAKRKETITALEAANADLQTKLTGANSQLHELTVGMPLKAMAGEISSVPSLWTQEFSKHFKLESIDGNLTLQTSEGKPVVDKTGRAVPFERSALIKLLTEGNDERAKIFQNICIVSRASGAAGSMSRRSQSTNRTSANANQRVQFGLGFQQK